MPPSRQPHAPKSLRLLTLGGAVLLDSSSVLVGEQRRRMALMALLAVAGEHGVSRDVLVSLLSPESPADVARHALQQLLYYLRRQLGEAAFLGTDPLRLNPALISSDVDDFTAALARGDLEVAVELYRGPFLEGFHLGESVEFEEWAAGERSHFAGRYADALARLAAESDAQGDHQRAIDWWQRLVLLDPLSGRAEIGLMQALAAAGDTTGAVRRAHLHQARVREELGMDADPQVAELAARLQRAARPVEVVNRVASSSHAGPPPGVVQPLPRTPRRFALVAGVLGGALALALVAISAWVQRPALPTGDLVAVVPFRVGAADPGLAWLGEGMVELLSIRLAGEGGMQVAEPGTLLSAWHRRMPAGLAEVPEDAVWSVAAGIGAGRVVQGSVTGGLLNVGLSAWILAPGRKVVAHASVDGPTDSLPQLVDRLAVQLLGLGAELEADRLSSLTSSSLAATRAFLAGRAAFRRGRMEDAIQEFRQAVQLDSGFALAGLDLFRASSWTGSPAEDLGRRIALTGRARLGSADRALLDVMIGQWINAPVMFAKWSKVTAVYPERPEGWYGLGDAYYHWGALSGVEDFAARAEDAFRIGWSLDSAGHQASGLRLVPEPMLHLVELAHLRGDTAEVRRLVALVLSVDSGSHLAQTLRWHLAVIDGDAARRRYWSAIGAVPRFSVRNIIGFATWTGIGDADLPEANAREARRNRTQDPGFASYRKRTPLLNGGTPSSLPLVSEFPGWLPREGLRSRIREAMHWDGDSAAAILAVRELSRHAEAPLANGHALRAQLQDVCTVGNWRAAAGDGRAAESANRKLKAAHLTGLTGADSSSFVQSVELCAAILDAAAAPAPAGHDARRALDRADSLARTNILEVCCGEAVTDANLLIARLWERQGLPLRALAAIRRRAAGFGLDPLFLSTFLREEGRLSLLTGDTVGAVRAYRRYLELRYMPEPKLRRQVDSVQRLVAELER